MSSVADLAVADGHIAEFKRRIEELRQQIAQGRAQGHDTSADDELLQTFLATLEYAEDCRAMIARAGADEATGDEPQT